MSTLIEDLDIIEYPITDQKRVSKRKSLRNMLLKCRREIASIILITLVIAMVVIIGKIFFHLKAPMLYREFTSLALYWVSLYE